MLPEFKKIGRYEIIDKIGQGGFATVFLGRDPYINRSVAIKVNKFNADKEPALSRLFQEAAAAGALIHPNIVMMFDAGIQEPVCYIAMEYVEGTSLQQSASPDNLMPLAEAIDAMIKVCHALDYAHQRGVIHRDIKPSNILMGIHGEIKIADFGLASFKELAALDKRMIGTPSYMPPEQVQGLGSTPKSDLFSAGVVLYRLLSGRKPFESTNSEETCRKIVEEPHTPLSKYAPELPPELFSIVDRVLAKDPEERYRSGFEFARDLESVLHGSHKPLGEGLAERISHLRTLHFFEDFSDSEIAGLLSIGAWLKHKPGEEIIRENDDGKGFFVISSGAVAVMIGGKNLRTLSRGDCFGEIAFLLGAKRTATICAIGDTNLLRLNPEKIEILEKDAQIKLYRLFARTIAGNLLEAIDRIVR